MSSHYEEAPALPREPTAISVPAAMQSAPPSDPTTTTTTTTTQSFAPPPKFPSMTDVALQNAVATQQTIQPTDDQTPVDQEMASFIQAHTVVPGTGAKKALEAASREWTDQDQKLLDNLLSDGRDVYVPADISRSDLPQTYHTAFFPAKPTDTVIPPPDAAWQQVVSSPDSPIVPADVRSRHVQAAAIGAASAATAAAAIDAEDPPADSAPDPSDQVADRAAPPSTQPDDRDAQADPVATQQSPAPFLSSRPAPPQKKADVSRSIFGGSFETVPVITRTSKDADETPLSSPVTDDDNQLATTHDVRLPSDSYADVNVTDDYGLKGGHDAGVHDAAFLDHDTLVTGGSDGKVCIWDMTKRAVHCEFVPYGGEAVTMVYPMPEEDGTPSKNLLTLSKSRLMRIWAVDETLAFLLRSIPIPESDNDLYMSVPVISKELKERAAAAAVAAAVAPTQKPEVFDQADHSPADAAAEAAPAAEAAVEPTSEEKSETLEDDGKDEKRFSFTKRVIGSFRRNSSSRKAVAS